MWQTSQQTPTSGIWSWSTQQKRRKWFTSHLKIGLKMIILFYLGLSVGRCLPKVTSLFGLVSKTKTVIGVMLWWNAGCKIMIRMCMRERMFVRGGLSCMRMRVWRNKCRRRRRKRRRRKSRSRGRKSRRNKYSGEKMIWWCARCVHFLITSQTRPVRPVNLLSFDSISFNLI